MAEKKVAKPAKATAKKTTKRATAKGDSFVCEVCGLAVTVDTVCGCAEVCDIICCGQTMKEKKTRAKAAKK